TTCAKSILDHESVTLNRCGFSGIEWIETKWDPEKPSSASSSKITTQCESHCRNMSS
ncbi:hypothetical protein Angca_001205, partial [Angiostrongylus cantonensis]